MASTEIAVRHAALTDAREIASVHCASWRDAYANVLDADFLSGPIEDDRRGLWFERLERPDSNRIVLIAENAGSTVVGFGCGYRDLDPLWGSLIDNLHVYPQFRGKGAGRRLIGAVARCIDNSAVTRGAHLWVFEANEAALRFYLRLGGQIAERGSSEIPAAHGAAVLRIVWPDIASLVD